MVPADGAIVHLRRLLLDAARGVAAGEEPPRLPSLAKVSAIADTEIAAGARWQDLAPGNLAGGRMAAE
jgi:hypothetical protein